MMDTAGSPPQVVSLLKDLPSQLDEERFETLLERPGWHLECIISAGQTTPEGEWYDQEDNEWVLVLQGAGRLAFEDGSERHLEKGDTLLLPAGCRHRVVWTSPDEITVWLALHFEKNARAPADAVQKSS